MVLRGRRRLLVGGGFGPLVALGLACGSAAAPGLGGAAPGASPAPAARPAPALSPSPSPPPSPSPSPSPLPVPGARACPGLHGPLRTIAEFSDPSAGARLGSYPVVDGRVEVTIVKAPKAEWGDLVERYDLQEVERSPNFMDAFVPLDQLCDLAKDPRVAFVSPPIRATPAATPGR